jgi:diaminohydroxyphosphoribosylaminopyrimidine deaminase/5-amino-6-(5-phosphoribosylamino)uracil reductase
MTSPADEYFMKAALREAVKGLGYTSPNPLVGAVAVRGEQVIAKAHHQKFGATHAEVALLKKMKPQAARGVTVYVNLEPCCHYGKTSPCTDALISAGVGRVVVGHEDPNPLVSGKGIAQLRAAGIPVVVGVLEREARKVNAPFLTYITKGRPWILLKVAQSLDGRIALKGGQSRWITGEAARVEVHRLRAQLDAVIVGSQTVVDDDPELTVRHIEGRNPLRIVMDSMLRIAPEARVLHQTDNGRTWVMTTPNASQVNRRRIEETGATVLECPGGSDGKLDLSKAMKLLAGHGLTSVFVEGGGTLHASFVKAGLFDKFIVAIAPMMIGSDGRPSIWELGFESMDEVPRLVIRKNRRIGEDIWLEMERDVHRDR